MSSALTIAPAGLADADALFAFECENRAFFERWVAPRDAAFYTPEAVTQSLAEAEATREADRMYAYIAWVDGEVVGRVNLRHVLRGPHEKASLGYRMGERHGGRGYATEAVRLVLAEAFGPLGLWRVEAVAIESNAASQRILGRNGFRPYGRSTRSTRLHGAWHDLLHYERHRTPLSQSPRTMPDIVNLLAQADALEELWSPRIVGQVNDQYVKVAKVEGTFPWHQHDAEDELFLVLRGHLRIEFEDSEASSVELGPGQMTVVPKGVRHRPVAEAECLIALIETVTTQHTGREETPLTRSVAEQLG